MKSSGVVDEQPMRCEGVTREKVSKIENACQDYMFSTLLEVCNALDNTLDEISKNYEDT